MLIALLMRSREGARAEAGVSRKRDVAKKILETKKL